MLSKESSTNFLEENNMTSEEIWRKAKETDIEEVMAEFLRLRGTFKRNKLIVPKELMSSAYYVSQLPVNMTSRNALAYEIEKFCHRNFLIREQGSTFKIEIPDNIFNTVRKEQESYINFEEEEL